MEKVFKKEDIGISQDSAFGRAVAGFVMRLLSITKLNELVKELDSTDVFEFVDEILHKMDVNVDCASAFVANIPKSGGFVAVANFPHGVMDCLALLKTIGKNRKDVKFLIEPHMATLPLIREISVSKSFRNSYKLSKEVVNYLRGGGALVVFPANTTATYSGLMMHPKDTKWDNKVMKFAKLAQVPILPFFIEGRASKSSLVLNTLFPKINSLLYVTDFFKQKGLDLSISVGSVISYKDILKRARAENFRSSFQDQIVCETIRGITFMQSIKLNEGYQSPVREKKSAVENLQTPSFVDSLDGAQVILNRGVSKAYLIDNQFIVYSGETLLFTAQCRNFTFDSSGTASQMSSFEDFEFNYKHLRKNFQSCVEMTNVRYSEKILHGHHSFLESAMKSLTKFYNSDAIFTNVHSNSLKGNLMTSLFVYYLESRYAKSSFKKAIFARGSYLHGDYVGHTLRNEALNFYNASLFADYGKKVENLCVSDELLLFLSLGSKVGAISLKVQNDGDHQRSFLVILS